MRERGRESKKVRVWDIARVKKCVREESSEGRIKREGGWDKYKKRETEWTKDKSKKERLKTEQER